MPRRVRPVRLATVVAGVMLAGCSTAGTGHGGPSSARPASSTPPPRPSSTAPRSSSSAAAHTSAKPPAGDRAAQVLATMSEAQRVGQLLMVDCASTAIGDATLGAIMQDHVGSVILDGTSQLGIAQTASLTRQLQQDAPAGVGLFVATDQEGGIVQRLQGAGFSAIPSAVQQGNEAPSVLQQDWTQWGGELQAAGINVDLGPVLDTVPPGSGPNPPIGDLDREYGHDPAAVASHGTAVVRGLATAGVSATAKHFPGLGRVAGNTDTASGVRDTVTTRHDPYLAPFAAAVGSGVPFVMMSTAIYTRIDAQRPAAFSKTIVTGMLRDDLGFGGVIISDDLGAAQQVSGYPIGERAVQFVAAGGDIVLTVDATQAPQMTAALLARARTDPAFGRLVDAAALKVLQAKQSRGLLH
ncbi:MAG: glycoside hydrolase family 3 N-terminal domain-containing protein [Jatrophihabitans sp.]